MIKDLFGNLQENIIINEIKEILSDKNVYFVASKDTTDYTNLFMKESINYTISDYSYEDWYQVKIYKLCIDNKEK